MLRNVISKASGPGANDRSNTFNVGDAEYDKQMAGILPFDTSAIPADATITGAVLTLTRAGKIGEGDDPGSGLGDLVFDLRCPASPDGPYYGLEWGVDLADLEAFADFREVDVMDLPAANFQQTTGTIVAGADALDGIAKGVGSTTNPMTQVRVRFSNDDNGNLSPDYLLFYAGENPVEIYRPTLLVTYELPAPDRVSTGGDE